MAVDFSLRHLCLLLGTQLKSWPKLRFWRFPGSWLRLSWRTKACWLMGWLVGWPGRMEVSGLINLLSGIGDEGNGPSADSAELVQLQVAREQRRNWTYHRSWKDANPFASVVGSGHGVAGRKHRAIKVWTFKTAATDMRHVATGHSKPLWILMTCTTCLFSSGLLGQISTSIYNEVKSQD